MSPRNLPLTASLETLWTEMSYTRARFSGDADAADLAATLDPYLAEIEEARIGQRRAEMDVIAAQAQCDYVNARLDDTVIDLADELLYILKDRTSSRFTRYFQQTPYSIVRMALDSELAVVRRWTGSLATEPEESLKAFATRFDGVFALADAALEAQTKALNTRKDLRVRNLEPLAKKLNEARYRLFGQLVTRADEKKLSKQWPHGFFKAKSRRGASGSEPEELETPKTDDPT